MKPPRLRSGQALTILYRGPLSSCNYGCEYCPFAKHHETPEEHAVDAAALARFGEWCLSRTTAPLRVFFTPWGEALTQVRYHELNLTAHPSKGQACQAGESVISVDGEGTARRCHFIPAPIGNIYDAAFESALQPRACSNDTCGCHIGYVHLDYLELRKVFGAGLLERIPTDLSASRISVP